MPSYILQKHQNNDLTTENVAERPFFITVFHSEASEILFCLDSSELLTSNHY